MDVTAVTAFATAALEKLPALNAGAVVANTPSCNALSQPSTPPNLADQLVFKNAK